MTDRRRALIEAGRWLKSERERVGASAMLVAKLATILANRQGDPVKIHQQQISDIENAGADRGPRALRPWFRHVRAAFESGLIADALGRSGMRPAPAPRLQENDAGEERYEIRDSRGRIVGEIRWFGTPAT